MTKQTYNATYSAQNIYWDSDRKEWVWDKQPLFREEETKKKKQEEKEYNELFI